MSVLDKYRRVIQRIDPIKYIGHISKVQGLLLESLGPRAVVGELCSIKLASGKEIPAEVIALKQTSVLLMPYADVTGIEIGSLVIASGEVLQIPVSNHLLGRIVDGLGRPLDDAGGIAFDDFYPLIKDPPLAMKRPPITQRICTGVRAIDGMLPMGQGQRIGIFAGSGIGKSTLLGMIARYTNADINVIALIGERGREVREFIADDLGPEGLKKSVVIVATSDMPALARLRAAYAATAIAEYFRDQGKNVMLLFDSVTRFAMAQREIGLAAGEPPATRGYTPSVFSLLPKLLERSGASEKGSITGFYTILVEGDDMDEPISDAVRGTLDGHIVLSRALAQKAHYPAISVLESISRLAPKLVAPQTMAKIMAIRKLLAVYKENEDLISVGAYVKGSNTSLDEAIEKIENINAFFMQSVDEPSSLEQTLSKLSQIAGLPLTEDETIKEGVAQGNLSESAI